jgi:hypothetical protein
VVDVSAAGNKSSRNARIDAGQALVHKTRAVLESGRNLGHCNQHISPFTSTVWRLGLWRRCTLLRAPPFFPSSLHTSSLSLAFTSA